MSRIPPRPVSAIGLLALALIFPTTAAAQLSPEESAKKLKPAEGLQVDLWASEPMLVNPTTLDVDSRGRVWVTEGLNYRLTRGGNKQFHRIEDADKIKILEDTDGDGKADKMTVFADRVFPVPMGIAVEEHWSKEGKYEGCRVFVGNSPDLLVLEDTDGDDVADRRYPLLTGFGGIDSDHGVHGMVLGLDGKLYFTHGDGCCSVQQDHSERQQNFDVVDRSGRHVASDQLANTLRANRDGTQFEIIADRQRNNYETCLNSFGNQFTSDNDDDGNRGSRVIWIMDGGNYGYRTPGSPRHWGEDVPGIVPKLAGTGNGSPCGVMVYEGDLLPKPYQGALLEAEAGPRVIYAFPLKREGAAFRTTVETLLSSDDNWFRPVDVCAAPDGSLLVADWYDGGVGGHAFRDQTTGRIYRITPKDNQARAPIYDFSTVDGLIAALESPNIAARDVARRILIARITEGKDGGSYLPADKTFQRLEKYAEDESNDPVNRARVLWTIRGIYQGLPRSDEPYIDWEDVGKITPFALEMMSFLDASQDPRIREQVVRMLGRDVSDNGHVEYNDPSTKQPPPAEKNLKLLLRMVGDPDPGVRRELILAIRDVPTEKVRDALKMLAAQWDGRDRWYLEALGLALRDRESGLLTELFDGTLYGDLRLDEAGVQTKVALPPYFPVDRNEAFLAAGEELPPASNLSKTLGLAWEVHRPEVLMVLRLVMPSLKTPELQQAADDVIMQIDDPAAAESLAAMATESKDAIRRRQILATLARKLDGDWRPARRDAEVLQAADAALADPETRVQAIELAAATGEPRFGEPLAKLAQDAESPAEVRVAAVEALGRIMSPEGKGLVERLIAEARERKETSPAAEAAVRTLPRFSESGDRLLAMLTDEELPLPLRREALRAFAQRGDGGRRLVDLARDGKLPEALKTEASVVLHGHPDRGVRDAAKEVLPLTVAGGKPLPSFGELLRRDGDAEKGRTLFFQTGTNACASCHRVQGRGQWIGPDLSTIGTKYGKDELLRSILDPSAAVGYSYRSVVVALDDGRVVTGLPVEEGADRLVLKTADGERVRLRPEAIVERRQSDVSLMPEGLAQALGEQDLVDLLAFLATLKQPVSIVGQFQAAGPVAADAVDPATVETADPVAGADGAKHPWRRLQADAEGRVDLSTLLGNDTAQVVYLHAPVTSPAAQDARLVLDGRPDVRAWLAGRPVELSTTGDGSPRSATVRLPKGTSDLLIRVPAGPDAAVVATFVADLPLEFSPADAAVTAR